MLSAATESEPSPLSFGLSNLGPISILPSWVLDLVVPCNPVMEPHLKARRIPQRTISLKQSHYQCLSMCGGHSKATGRSSASTRGHRGEVLPSTLTSRLPSLSVGPQSPDFCQLLCLAPSCHLVCCYNSRFHHVACDRVLWLLVQTILETNVDKC